MSVCGANQRRGMRLDWGDPNRDLITPTGARLEVRYAREYLTETKRVMVEGLLVLYFSSVYSHPVI